MVNEHFSCIVGSTLVEDMFGVAKNTKQVRGSQIFRKPERSMDMIVAQSVPSKRHRFDMCEPDTHLPRKEPAWILLPMARCCNSRAWTSAA